MADTALQRKNMVESQIRPSDVTDRRITAAMTIVPRERFLPASLTAFAYSDESLLVKPGREVLPPRVLAKLIQLAEITATDKVLVISESGYAAAVVAQMAAEVVALLPGADDATFAGNAFRDVGLTNAVAVSGPAAAGWSAGAPYEVVLIEGGIQQVPDEIKSQLQEKGRLVAVATNDRIGRGVVLLKHSGTLARRDAFQAAAITLSGFTEPRPAFVF
jgi:protein-L-isoaspartate(D-aspartate) O-methyltransferase